MTVRLAVSRVKNVVGPVICINRAGRVYLRSKIHVRCVFVLVGATFPTSNRFKTVNPIDLCVNTGVDTVVRFPGWSVFSVRTVYQLFGPLIKDPTNIILAKGLTIDQWPEKIELLFPKENLVPGRP
jgi:hypothetical protein